MKHAMKMTTLILACSMLLPLTSQSQALFAEGSEVQLSEGVFEIKQWQDIALNGLDAFVAGQKPQWIVEWNEGLTLPVYLNINGDFLIHSPNQDDENNTEPQQPAICVYTTGHAYVRCVDGKLLFSDDLTEWVSFKEFSTGEITAGVTDCSLHLNLTLRRRR